MERQVPDRRCWAGAIILRSLATGGDCRYRYDDDRLSNALFTKRACESLVSAHEALRDADRQLFLRVLLLVPWEAIVRSTGLPLRVGNVLDVLSGVSAAALVTAVNDVIEAGPDAVKALDLDEALPEERGPGTGLVVELSREDRLKVGVTARRLEFDRLEVAVSSFRPHGWEANLRVLVPWWLDASQPEARDRRATSTIRRTRRDGASDAGRYRLLGLLDWMCAHPEQPEAGTVLALGIEGRDGAVRKAAAALAAAMGETEVVEKLVRCDPDKGVMKRAQKLLDALAVDKLF
jgi:hypothetical protein